MWTEKHSKISLIEQTKIKNMHIKKRLKQTNAIANWSKSKIREGSLNGTKKTGGKESSNKQ